MRGYSPAVSNVNEIDESELVAGEAFVTRMHALTVNLVRLNPVTGFPAFLSEPHSADLIASGVIWNAPDRQVLLCAGHTLRTGTWGLETKIDWKDRQTLLLKLEPSMTADPDFGWVDLTTVLASLPVESRPEAIPKYCGTLDAPPRANEDYGFACANRVQLGKGYETSDLFRERGFEIGMRFQGSDSDGRYIFKLARKHRGDTYYDGSSGAPIANRSGAIVSLVSGGDKDADVIYGVPLAKVVSLLPGGD